MSVSGAWGRGGWGVVERREHREITLIELQSLVVFGCAALLFMVGQLSVHMIEKRGGMVSYCV